MAKEIFIRGQENGLIKNFYLGSGKMA